MMITRISACLTVLVGTVLMVLAATPAQSKEHVATAVSVIYPGQTIEAGMVKIVRLKRVMPNAENAVERLDDLVGKVAVKTILPNRLIFRNSFTEGNIVEAGQSVRVIYQTSAITISMEAVALQGGTAGDVVRVRNRDSARIISGRISDGGVVYVSTR